MVELMGGQSVLIHHMSYIDYDSFKHGEGRVANDRRNDQRALFSRADHAFGVGPLLRDRLADLLGRSSADTSMLIPGLADIEPLPSRSHSLRSASAGSIPPTTASSRDAWPSRDSPPRSVPPMWSVVLPGRCAMRA
jgi:hypothetical protein